MGTIFLSFPKVLDHNDGFWYHQYSFGMLFLTMEIVLWLPFPEMNDPNADMQNYYELQENSYFKI